MILPAATLAKLTEAQSIATYWRAQLGEATYRSQNHVVSTPQQDGTVRTETKRDSDGRPPGNKKVQGPADDTTDEEACSPTAHAAATSTAPPLSAAPPAQPAPKLPAVSDAQAAKA